MEGIYFVFSVITDLGTMLLDGLQHLSLRFLYYGFCDGVDVCRYVLRLWVVLVGHLYSDLDA